MYKKGQRFETSYDNETYEFVGEWSGYKVLAPENDGNVEVLIYTDAEINELMEEGKLEMITGPELTMG